MDIEELENKLPPHIYQKLINSKLDSTKSILLKNKSEIKEITKLASNDLALRVQLPRIYGGLEKGAVYICTEDPFPSKRLKQLTKSIASISPELNFEDNIFVEHVIDFEQLRFCLYVKLQKLICNVDIGIIIIDSITGVFRSFNEDRNYQSRSEDFQTIARKLYEYSGEHKIAIICTNQVSDNLETGEVNPCLGLAWSNWVTSRFCISRSFNRLTRTFKVIFAPHLPCCSCNFLIRENGIVDDV
ncbi:Rad51 [Popillia japonica]|uniref:Rad51 n=1 Tax=Popillia japonica TaxID=7064 RepID=A0AAW1KPK9_POPJA